MGMTETQTVGIQIEKVNKKLPQLMDLEDTFYSQLEKSASAQPVSNRSMRIPLKLRPGGRFGHFNPDNGDLGLGDGPTYDKAVITVAHLKYAIQWTKLTEWSTDSDSKAVVNAYNDLIAGAMPEFRRSINALCMTGGNGVLGTVSGVTTASGVDTITLNTDGFGAKLLRFGQPINIYDSTLATNRTASGEVQITFFDLPNKVIKAPATTGITTGDLIVASGLSGASPTSLLGIPYHNTSASTGTWLGFDRSTTPEIRANRVAAGGALALPFPRLAINKIGDRVGKSTTVGSVKAFMHPCQKQAYEGLGQLVSIIQKTAKDENLDLYFGDGMQMAGASIDAQFMWDKSRIDFLPMSQWGRAEMHKAAFYDVGGRKVFEVRGASGGVQTSQVQYITVSFNIFNQNPAAMSYIDTLTVPSGY
tara:strand:- start:1931 stop:3187 length:1257 start_codon:yes stop_codon:yes gene_type:complete